MHKGCNKGNANCMESNRCEGPIVNAVHCAMHTGDIVQNWHGAHCSPPGFPQELLAVSRFIVGTMWPLWQGNELNNATLPPGQHNTPVWPQLPLLMVQLSLLTFPPTWSNAGNWGQFVAIFRDYLMFPSESQGTIE